MAKVTFLGLGAMGRRMARRLLDGGHELTVWNRSVGATEGLVAAGARAAETPRQAASGAEVVISCVTDDDAARAVWLGAQGAVAGLEAGALAIESSTVTLGWLAELGAAVDAAGARFLDGPVVGSTPQAEAGALVFLVGGEEADVVQARPLLDAMAAKTVHAGVRGRGGLLKLLVNASFATQVALMGELLKAGEAHGLSMAAGLELLGGLPVTSPAARGAGGLMVADDHARRFPVRLVAKDLRYAAALADLPLLSAVQGRFEAAADQGLADANLTAVVKA